MGPASYGCGVRRVAVVHGARGRCDVGNDVAGRRTVFPASNCNPSGCLIGGTDHAIFGVTPLRRGRHERTRSFGHPGCCNGTDSPGGVGRCSRNNCNGVELCKMRRCSHSTFPCSIHVNDAPPCPPGSLDTQRPVATACWPSHGPRSVSKRCCGSLQHFPGTPHFNERRGFVCNVRTTRKIDANHLLHYD